MKKLNLLNNKLCKLGIHGPLKNHEPYFTDIVNGKIVYTSQCPCGQHWMSENKKPFPLIKKRIK